MIGSLRNGERKYISMFGLDKWIEKMDNKVTLKYFKEKIALRKEMYYEGSYDSELLFKARSLSLEVIS